MQQKGKHKTSASLVLGSGGARGLAHIGVIKWLEKNDFEIRSISACSIGALIGGIYAAKKLDELEEWMVSLTKADVASLLDFSWSTSGLFKGDKVINTLISFLDDTKIEDLSIPFTAVAAELLTGKEVWINSGSLFEAIRASASLPLFFTPVIRGESVLVDGGVLNPVPIAPTFNDGTDITIAVNLGGPLIKQETDTIAVLKEKNVKSDLQTYLNKFVGSFNAEDQQLNRKKWTMYEVADRAFDAMQSTVAKMKIATYSPDIEITIPRNACGTFEFDRSAEMIKLGYRNAQTAYDSRIKNET